MKQQSSDNSLTGGLNHLGLSVLHLDASRDFFVNRLCWLESGRDDGDPRTAVSDGCIRLTLWEVDAKAAISLFDRRANIGLHHLALNVSSYNRLQEVHQIMLDAEDVDIEFGPELVGQGPRMHMMCYEPGGIRIEFIWSGED